VQLIRFVDPNSLLIRCSGQPDREDVMSERWFYGYDGERFGPVPLESLRQMIAAGQLLPTDLVWHDGLPGWQPASSVPALGFRASGPSEPPPLPVPHPVDLTDWQQAVKWAGPWLWRHKPVLFSLGIVASLLPLLIWAIVRRGERLPDPLVIACVIAAAIFGFALLIAGGVAVVRIAEAAGRKAQLQQKWEPVAPGSPWIQFCQDGGFLRGDGFGARYTFDGRGDTIHLTPADGGEPVTMKVVSLSPKELAVLSDGTTRIYRRVSWWRQLFG
jgi:hypothetical protein